MSRNILGPRLMSAIEQNDLDQVIRILAGRMANQCKVRQLLISEVQRSENRDFVDVPLMVAARSDCPGIIKHLVDTFKVDINHVYEYTVQGRIRRKTPLLQSVRSCVYATAGMILSIGADPAYLDRHGRSALHHAVRHADCRMVRLLLAHGARPTVNDDDGDTPLHAAARLGHVELVMLLARHGADLYGRDKDGAPVIHVAAKHGHASLVRTLVASLEVEADLRVTCYDGKAKAPIHVAAQEAHSDTVHTLLLWCSANVQLTDSVGDTALHYAVSQSVDPLGTGSVDGQTVAETVRVLLGFSVPVRSQNNRGETALHLAAYNRLTRAIEVMLSAGCDPLIKDASGKRPQDVVPIEDSALKQLLIKAAAEREKSPGQDVTKNLFAGAVSRRLPSSPSLCCSNSMAARKPSMTRSGPNPGPNPGPSTKTGMTLAGVLERVQRTTKKSTSNSTCNTCSSQTSITPTSSTAIPLKYPLSSPQQRSLPSPLSSRSYVTKGRMRWGASGTFVEKTNERHPQQKKQQNFERRKGPRRDVTVERNKPIRLTVPRGRPTSSVLARSNSTAGSQRTSYKSINRGSPVTVLRTASRTLTKNQASANGWSTPPNTKQNHLHPVKAIKNACITMPKSFDRKATARKSFSQVKVKTQCSSSSDESVHSDSNSPVASMKYNASGRQKNWSQLMSMLSSTSMPSSVLADANAPLLSSTINRKQTTSCAIKSAVNKSIGVKDQRKAGSKAHALETYVSSETVQRGETLCQQSVTSLNSNGCRHQPASSTVPASRKKSRTILSPKQLCGCAMNISYVTLPSALNADRSSSGGEECSGTLSGTAAKAVGSSNSFKKFAKAPPKSPPVASRSIVLPNTKRRFDTR